MPRRSRSRPVSLSSLSRRDVKAIEAAAADVKSGKTKEVKKKGWTVVIPESVISSVPKGVMDRLLNALVADLGPPPAIEKKPRLPKKKAK